MHCPLARILSLALLLSLGCSLHTDGGDPDDPELSCEVQHHMNAWPKPAVDLLFVIDDAPTMAAHADKLATNIDPLLL